MMILAGGIRAFLSARGPQTTFALSLAFNAPDERMGALLRRLEANREVVNTAEGWVLARSRSPEGDPSGTMLS